LRYITQMRCMQQCMKCLMYTESPYRRCVIKYTRRCSIQFMKCFVSSELEAIVFLSVYRALLSVYRALLSVYRALLSVWSALSHQSWRPSWQCSAKWKTATVGAKCRTKLCCVGPGCGRLWLMSASIGVCVCAVFLYVCMHICICKYLYSCVCVCVCAYIYM